ncbi:hypothetical protein ACFW04_002807 [Cataglyphis niger]
MRQRVGGDTPVAVAAVVCGCLNCKVVVAGVGGGRGGGGGGGDGGGGGGGGLNFSRVHGFTYVSHYTGPRLSRRLGGYTSGHGPRTRILATFAYVTAFLFVVLSTRDRRKYVQNEMPAFVTFASHLGRYISTRGLRLCWWARSSVLHFYIKSILSIPRMAAIFDR